MITNNYYIYALLDPRKPGKYTYDGLECSFLYEPFYIGKGKGNRCKSHFYEYSLKIISYKNNKIKKIIKEIGKTPIILKIKENLYENDALYLEKNYIEIIGKFIEGEGPLTNRLDGGNEVPFKSNINNPVYNVKKELHPSTKLTQEDAKQIRYLYKNKINTTKEISRIFNISQSYVYVIIRNEEWIDENYDVIIYDTTGCFSPMYKIPSEQHPSSKLTQKDAEKIRFLYNKNKKSTKELMEIYNVKCSCIHRILNNKTYIDKNYIPLDKYKLAHIYRKLTDNDIKSIIYKHNTLKISKKELAKEYNVNIRTISRNIKKYNKRNN